MMAMTMNFSIKVDKFITAILLPTPKMGSSRLDF